MSLIPTSDRAGTEIAADIAGVQAAAAGLRTAGDARNALLLDQRVDVLQNNLLQHAIAKRYTTAGDVLALLEVSE